MKTRTRRGTSAGKSEVKKHEPIVIKVKKMRGGKAHLISEEKRDNDLVELTL